jgi:hypothetical protein
MANASNIKLGDTFEKIAASISTMQANKLAKATLLTAKRKIAEQAKQKEIEGEQT